MTGAEINPGTNAAMWFVQKVFGPFIVGLGHALIYATPEIFCIFAMICFLLGMVSHKFFGHGITCLGIALIGQVISIVW